MTEIVRIYTNNSLVINRLAQLLDEEKIASIVRDNSESARLAGFGAAIDDVDLLVQKSDVERAQEVIRLYIENSDRA